jgi:HD superfamily phosphodiesterase
MNFNFYLSKHAELKTLYELVKRDFFVRGLMHHNWNHVLRDLAKGVMIGEAESANMKIVLASVLLHDIGRLYPEEGSDHYISGAEIASKYLVKTGFRESEIGEITHCIRAHGPRGIDEPRTLEAKVCYDIDVLSCSVGFIGVARVFDNFMREEKMGVKAMMKLPSGMKGPRKDFYTTTGKTMGEEGIKKAREFWEELRRELRKEEQAIREIIPRYKGD